MITQSQSHFIKRYSKAYTAEAGHFSCMGECMDVRVMKKLKEVDFWLHSKNLGLKLIEQNYMWLYICVYTYILCKLKYNENYIQHYFLVRYTYNPIKMMKISNAVTTMPSKIKEMTVAPTGYVNQLICHYINIAILVDVSSDDDDGVKAIVDKHKP